MHARFKSEPITTESLQTAADDAVLLEHSDAIALPTQESRRKKSSHSATDYDNGPTITIFFHVSVHLSAAFTPNAHRKALRSRVMLTQLNRRDCRTPTMLTQLNRRSSASLRR